MVSCQKGPTRHAYAWQIGPFWQDTLDICYSEMFINCYYISEKNVHEMLHEQKHWISNARNTSQNKIDSYIGITDTLPQETQCLTIIDHVDTSKYKTIDTSGVKATDTKN